MKNKLFFSLFILLFAVTNCNSQDLYKWSKNCGRLVESHELYFWLVQSQRESDKKKAKIYKKINKKYISSIAEINSLIQNEKISTHDKNAYLIRSIHYLNLSNKLLESIDEKLIENKTENFDDIYNNAFEAQKEYAINIINQPDAFSKSIEYKAINLYADLYATDTINIEIKNTYLDFLKKVSSNNMKIIDSLKESLNNSGKNLSVIEKNLSRLSFFSEDVLKDRLEGIVLTHPNFPDDFFMRGKGILKSVGCNIKSIKELVFFNQKITENNFTIYFQPNIDKAKLILSEYMKDVELNRINALNLANHFVRNGGVLGQEIKDKLYKKDDKLYYLDNSILYEIIEKKDMISFQYDEFYNETGKMESHVLKVFSMQSHGNNRSAFYKIPTIITTFFDVFIFKKNRTLDKMKNPQDLIFLTRTDYPTTDSNGQPSSIFGNRNFHYAKVKSANKEDVLKAVPLLENPDTSINTFKIYFDWIN